jgi:hypothetical protein
MHTTSSEIDDWDLEQDAWMQIKRVPPRIGWCRSTFVYYEGRSVARAIMIGSNWSTEEMAQVQDIDLIQQYRDFLHVGPGWFRKFRWGGTLLRCALTAR